MKIGVSVAAFNEKHAVNIVKHFEPYVDRVVVSVSAKPWYGEAKSDNTAERIIANTGAVVMRRNWSLEHEQRNDTMDLLRDMDYVIVSHCDTWFTAQDLVKLKGMSLTDLHYATETRTYWKDFDTVIYPYPLLPTIIIRSDAEFTYSINIKDQVVEPEILPITCHHVSWVKTDGEVLEKIQSYTHAGEIQPTWFEEVWKNWRPDMTNFAPTTPHDFQETRHYSLPQELRLWQKS